MAVAKLVLPERQDESQRNMYLVVYNECGLPHTMCQCRVRMQSKPSIDSAPTSTCVQHGDPVEVSESVWDGQWQWLRVGQNGWICASDIRTGEPVLLPLYRLGALRSAGSISATKHAEALSAFASGEVQRSVWLWAEALAHARETQHDDVQDRLAETQIQLQLHGRTPLSSSPRPPSPRRAEKEMHAAVRMQRQVICLVIQWRYQMLIAHAGELADLLPITCHSRAVVKHQVGE